MRYQIITRVALAMGLLSSPALGASPQDAEPDFCGKYATKFAVDAVTSKILLEGGNLWDQVIYPQVTGSAPETTLQRQSTDEITYEVIVGVSPRQQDAENASQTRYYVKVSVIDQGSACSLSDEGIDLEQDIELEN